MLCIYDSATLNFNNLGFGVLKDLYSDPEITEVLNGEYNLEFNYLVQGFLYEKIVVGNIIKTKNELFRIWSVQNKENYVRVFCKQIVFDLEKNWLEDVYPQDKTADMAIDWIVSHTSYPNNFSVYGDCNYISSARYVNMNPIQAMYTADNAVIKRFGGELEFRQFEIIVHGKRGKDLGLQIRQGKNITGIEFNIDFSSVATRIMPKGQNGILLPEKYVDSPLINNYFQPLYHSVDVDVGVDEENGVSLEVCYEKMREAVQKLYDEGIDKPKVSISVDFVELSKTEEYKKYSNLEAAHLGDTCKIYIPKYNLNLETRIVKTVYNCNKKRITQLEIGSIVPDYVSNNVETSTTINNALQEIDPNTILQQAKQNATDMLNHPFGGAIYIDKVAGNMYILDNNNINEAQNIWKWGLGGLGFSSNGINGPYETAMTADGKIVADFITTGQLNTNVIEGYNSLLLLVKDLNDSLKQMGFDFNTENLTIFKSGANNKTVINEQGISNKDGGEQLNLVANNNGLGGKDLIVTGSAQIGYARAEKGKKTHWYNPNFPEKYRNVNITNVFYLESNIQTLDDLLGGGS